MKTHRFSKMIQEMKRNESSASHVLIGAMLIVTILYATTIS